MTTTGAFDRVLVETTAASDIPNAIDKRADQIDQAEEEKKTHDQSDPVQSTGIDRRIELGYRFIKTHVNTSIRAA